MLKTRVIPTLLCRGRELVKGERFDSWRVVGNTLQAARVHNMRQVDELCILSVDGMMNLDDVQALCADCFMPVSIGGGVRTLEDFRALLAAGADKVTICTEGLDRPSFIREVARKYGSQSVVVVIDAKDGRVWAKSGTYRMQHSPETWARMAEADGAGEILLQSIDREGTMQGYDLDLIHEVSSVVSIPVIASGGCSGYADMAAALDAGAHAVAVGALFQFTDCTPQGASEWLHGQGYNTRLAA